MVECSKTTIQKVADNYEKQCNYTNLIARYKKACEQEFYFEALWILYAMIEDRTTSLLYYMGFLSSKDRLKITGSKKINYKVREILCENENDILYFSQLSNKINYIRKTVKWANTSEPSDDYQELLKKYFTSTTFSKYNIFDCLNNLDEFRDKRNQIMHALFNKNYQAVSNEVCDLLNKGSSAVHIIDNCSKMMKQKNIRAKFNIQ